MRGAVRSAGVMVILATVVQMAGAGDANAEQEPEPDRHALSPESIDHLLEQYVSLVEEVKRMRSQLERLARIARETQNPRVPSDDLALRLNDLASDDYAERNAASDAMRRGLVDRAVAYAAVSAAAEKAERPEGAHED